MNSFARELSKILNISNPPHYQPDAIIEYVSVDSRNIFLPEKTLFIALEGNKTTGADYVESLVSLGVVNFLVSNKYHSKFQHLAANFFFVENPLMSFQHIVEVKRSEYQVKTIGITGSNGKTIVKEWLSEILQKKYHISKSPKSYNSQIGVPLSIWGLNDKHNLAIYEAGISKKNEMGSLEKMIKPNIGILTHLGDAHQSNFKSKEEKLIEKMRLFVHSEILITKNSLVVEHNNAFQLLKNENKKLKIITWGETDNSDIIIKQIEAQKSISVSYQQLNYTLHFRNFEPTFIENCCHCIAVILVLEGDLKNYIGEIEHLNSLEMRLELIEGIYNTTIINDTYNADLDSLKIAIQFLFQQSPHQPKTIILSEILETEESYKEIENLLQNRKLHQLIFIGENYASLLSNFQKLPIDKVSIYSTASDFVKYHAHNTLKDNTILVKGARKFHLEDVVQFYRRKTHSTYLKVHLNALKNNLSEFAKRLRLETKIMIMLKAHGYGLGSVEIAKLLESERVDYYAVAYTDEGIELRNAGIQKPIMVMNPELSALEKLIDYHLEPEIYSLSILEKMIEAVNKNTIYRDSKLSIHLKIETGMHRLGIIEEDIPRVLSILKSSPNIQVKAIFSHLSASDEESLDDFTESQIQVFIRVSEYIEKELGYPTTKHILNTGGIIRHTQYQMDMVRLGIGLFGFDSTGILQSNLQNTISLISKITQIKSLKVGESTGYSRKGMVTKDSKIGIINVGYADGYFRSFGNGVASVFVKNQYAPTIGNICMDMTMVDLTDVIGVEEGDEVELIGNHILATDLAQKSNTISYEILTSISSRVQRVYWED